MSIESTLERIAISVERSELLLGKILAKLDDLPTYESEAPQAVPAPVPPAPAPAPAAPVPEVTFVPPPPPPVPAATVPFNDSTGLLKYCMERYRALGPTKGPMIQTVINGMGYKNVSEVPADRWAEFYGKCEAL